MFLSMTEYSECVTEHETIEDALIANAKLADQHDCECIIVRKDDPEQRIVDGMIPASWLSGCLAHTPNDESLLKMRAFRQSHGL